VMKRIAAPMIGGLFTSFLMELLVYPAIYLLWREPRVAREKRVLWPRAAATATAIAIAAFFLWPHATSRPLFPRYESVRQALLSGSLEQTKSAATQLASDAKQAGQERIASRAALLSRSASMDTARDQFAALSEAMIAYRNAGDEKPKPEVVYCSMAKRAWLQPAGNVANPYYADAAMRGCGEIKSN